MSDPHDPNATGWAAPGGSTAPPPPPPAETPSAQTFPPGSGYVQQGYGYGISSEQRTAGLAVAALVCGIVGVFVAAIPLGALALIFGLVSLTKINNSEGAMKGRGLAITGIVLGPIDIAVGIFILSRAF